MPIYDYRCVACANQIEVIHAIAAPGPTVCEVCGGAMRKALSAPAIHFKGSGWAKKDAQTASKAASKTNQGKDGDSSSGDGAGKGAEQDKGGSDKGGSDKGGSDKGGSDKGGGAGSDSTTTADPKPKNKSGTSSSPASD